LGLADGSYQPLGTANPGHDANADFRLRKACCASGNDDVSMHSQFAAATVGVAADSGDYRLGAMLNRGPGTLSMPLQNVDWPCPDHAGNIAPGSKDGIAAGEDDAAYVRVGTQLTEMLCEHCLQFKTQGVGRGGPVQGQ